MKTAGRDSSLPAADVVTGCEFSLPEQLEAELNLTRAARAPVIWPNVSVPRDVAQVKVRIGRRCSHALSTVVHCVWLKALMKSARNCRRLLIG